MTLQNASLPGCCGINVLFGFNKIPQKGTWNMGTFAAALNKATTYDKGDKPLLQPLVLFSHSTAQDKNPLNPRTLADWLTQQGERVYPTRNYISERHGNRITLFAWHPSKQFKELYNTEIGRKNPSAAAGRPLRRWCSKAIGTE